MASALDRVKFNEYGDYLDTPYVVKAIKGFDVNMLDENDNIVEGDYFHVEAGSIWEIWHPSSTNDVHLDGDGYYLDLNWDDLALFELLEEGGYNE